MKVFLLLFALTLSVVSFGQRAKIVFNQVSYDFGKIYQKNGAVECEFKYKNEGATPLILTNVRAGCGCTTPEWSRKPLPPDGEGKIKVVFDPRNQHIGQFMKSISVLSNAENSVMTLTIKGSITNTDPDPFANFEPLTKELKIATKSLNFGNIKHTETMNRTIELLNVSEQTVALSVVSSNKHIGVKVYPERVAPGKTATISVTYSAVSKKEFGMVSDRIAVTAKPGGTEYVEIRANIKENFEETVSPDGLPVAEFSSNGTDFGTISRNMTVKREITLTNKGTADLHIRKITPSDASVTANAKAMVVKPGKSIDITVTIKTGNKPGKKISSLVFIVNDPKNSIFSYKISGEIR